jgi:pimeloyl-ACP methyl ester carboxylesterase
MLTHHQHHHHVGTRRSSPPRRPPSLLLARPAATTPLRPRVAVVASSGGAPGRDPFSSSASAAPTPTTPNGSNDLPYDLLPAAMQPYGRKTWMWRGRRCSFVSAGCGRPVVLVHGFGASATQWRRLFTRLVDAGYKVYAPDLLGFGGSDMPLPSEGDDGKHFYRLELWRDQIADFCREFVGGGEEEEEGGGQGQGPVLVGNSVGSLACLMAAAGPVRARGVVLLNTAGALNNKGVVSDWRIVLAYPIFLLVDLLLSVRPVARALFDNVRDPETLANVLKAAYGDDAGAGAVDDELVDLIAAPAARPNALDVFVDVVTSPHFGPKPWDLVPLIRERGTPLLVAWGTEDKLTPLDGPVGRYFRALADGGGGDGSGEQEEGGKGQREKEGGSEVTFALLEGHGHCPHDDPRPTLAREHLLPWLAALPGGGGGGEGCEEEGAAAAMQQAART